MDIRVIQGVFPDKPTTAQSKCSPVQLSGGIGRIVVGNAASPATLSRVSVRVRSSEFPPTPSLPPSLYTSEPKPFPSLPPSLPPSWLDVKLAVKSQRTHRPSLFTLHGKRTYAY